MTALLFYSISSSLTKDEILEIDKQVHKNREAVYLFFTELPSSSKRKANVRGIYVCPFAPCVALYLRQLFIGRK